MDKLIAMQTTLGDNLVANRSLDGATWLLNMGTVAEATLVRNLQNFRKIGNELRAG
jgi:hypothetical protein